MTTSPPALRFNIKLSQKLLVIPALVLLTFLFVYPTVMFLSKAFVDGSGTVSLANFQRFFWETSYGRIVFQTLVIAFWVTFITILISYPVAYILATADKRRMSYWLLFTLLPFWSSFLVRTFALIFVLGRTGPLNNLAMGTGLVDEPMQFLFTRSAVLLGMTNVMVPFAILTMVGVLEQIDARLLPAAHTLGASPIVAFFRIYLPLSFPGVTAAALLVFVTCIGFFITPSLLGSERDMMIAQPIIQQVLVLSNWQFAATMCFILFLLTLAIFLVFDRLVGMSSLVGEDNARLRPTAPIAQQICNWMGDGVARLSAFFPRAKSVSHEKRSVGLRAFAVVVLVFLNIPVLFLIPLSLSETAFVTWPPVGFTLRWYQDFFLQNIWWEAAIRSFVVAFCTAILSIVIGLPAALAFTKLPRRTASVLLALIVSPMIIPRIIIGIGLFYLYASIGVVGSIFGLVLGHAVIALPFFFISMLAVLKTYDWRLNSAAASLGASPMQVFRHITLPLIATGLMSASIFAFVISLDELNIALFTTGGLTSTLPKMMWLAALNGFTPLLAAVSTMFLFFLSILVLVGLSFDRRKR